MQDILADAAILEPAAPDTGARLGYALFAYALAVTLIVTLLPFHFEVPEIWRFDIRTDPFGAIVGMMLFVPLGLFYRLATSRTGGSLLMLLATAGLIGTAIEAMQLFDVTRESSVIDIGANMLGALAGGLCYDGIARRARHQGAMIGWLGLEIPLMGLVYMLVPLLWVNTLAVRGDLTLAVMTLLLGAFGARLLGGLQRHYFGPRRAADPHHTAAFATAWFFVGAFGLLVWDPTALALGVVVTTFFCWWLGSRPLGEAGTNRRFEASLLRSAAPIYGAYLLMLIAFPLLDPIGVWDGSLGLPRMTASQVETAQLLELCAASSVLGYMVAEIRGRDVEYLRSALPRLIVSCVILAVAAEVVRGFGDQGASLVRGMLVVGACVYGGWLYYLQRAHVMWLLGKHRA